MIQYIIILALFLFTLSGCDKENTNPSTEPKACFSYTINSYSMSQLTPIDFMNCSDDATSYLWEFGDGETSTDKNPTHLFGSNFPYIVKLNAINDAGSDVLIDTIWNWTMVYKPNIYIYPEKEIDLCVSISFPKGGEVVTSIPNYADNWCVTIDSTGKIDNTYDFLFYESMQPNIWQHNEGWCIEKSDLPVFFTENMQNIGYNTNEINDFIEYWIPILNKYEYYIIYPQSGTIINKVIKIDFSAKPQYVNRFFYLIEGCNEPFDITNSSAIKFNKNGFYVNEWGVLYEP